MRFFPSHLQIETVNRICNARCTMCTINFIPDTSANVLDPNSHTGYARGAEIMSFDKYKSILDKFVPYKSYIKYISLHGCGEPLLDKSLVEKVKYTRDMGFVNVGFTSNCHFLHPSLSSELLKAGLSCIIPSIDGHTAETHEKIRSRTDFNRIRENVINFIQLRDQLGSDCKVVIRMVQQQDNIQEWPDYYKFWSSRLDSSKGDVCTGFEVHNTGGKVSEYNKKRLNHGDQTADINALFSSLESPHFKIDSASDNNLICLDPVYYEKQGLCPDIFTRLSIFASGKTALCSADQAEFHPIGSILDYDDPVELFNSQYFNAYRDSWIKRDVSCHKQCTDCTVAISRFIKHATN